MTLKTGDLGQLTRGIELEYEVIEGYDMNCYRGEWPAGTVVEVVRVYQQDGKPDGYNFEILGIIGCWDCELSDIAPMS